MTTEIKELSEKLAQMYGIPAIEYLSASETKFTYLAEDSGRISDLADDVGVDVKFFETNGRVFANKYSTELKELISFSEEFKDHPTKHDAARMARVRCLIAIKENE